MKLNKYEVPDGYFPTVLPRPLREVEVLSTAGRMARIRYLDNDEETTVCQSAVMVHTANYSHVLGEY